VSEVAAFAAWFGAAVIVLSDGRRGLALGLAVTTAAFTVLALVGGHAVAAAVLAFGGGFAAVQRSRTGPDVWGLMPPGSTPRLVLSIAGGLLALWISTTLMTGPGAPLRFAALSVIGLMGARALIEDADPNAVLTAIAALALSVAIAAGLAGTGAAPAPYVVAAVIAIGVALIRVRDTDAG